MHICKGDTTSAFLSLGPAMTAHMYATGLGVIWVLLEGMRMSAMKRCDCFGKVIVSGNNATYRKDVYLCRPKKSKRGYMYVR